MRRLIDELRDGLRNVPRGAVFVVAVGVLLSLLALAANRTDWQASADLDWVTVEEIETPGPVRLEGGGSIEMTRMTLSSLQPTDRGDFLFRVSGVLVVSSEAKAVTTRCDVAAPLPATIARTPKKRAAWPRPSEDLRLQQVPELMVIDFSSDGADLLGLPIRDSFRRYSDTAAPLTVEWDGFAERKQSWVWDLPEGSGAGPATLGFTVAFKTYRRPRATITCRSGAAEVRVEAEQAAWPIPATDPG
jgi:hypothetical protein